jgi:tetratricopeptide (TPR) repeat protein
VALNKDKVMDTARKFVEKGQLDKAVKEYLRIVEEEPKDVRVWLKIGDLYAKKGAKQDATETYLKVARFYQEQGFYLKAVAVYKQVLKLEPRLVDVSLKLAELYRQLGLLSDAMQHFEGVAGHFHREGNTKDALATIRQLVELDPENIATRIKLAELYSKEGLVDDAIKEFTFACEQLQRQGRDEDFLKVAERLLWHKPDNHPLNRELASLYLARNDPRRALQKLQVCFKADPRDEETLVLLAQAFQGLDQKAKAISVLRELARIHDENKQKEKAQDIYRAILELVPGDADAMAYLGTSAKAKPARVSTPITFANAVVGAPAGSAAARLTGSMPLLSDQATPGNFGLPDDDAAADDDFSADMNARDSSYRYSSVAGEQHADEIAKILAETDVYSKYGLHQKAIDHLRRVFSLDENNLDARERLKDILFAQGRDREALAELIRLIGATAPMDPDRASSYAREALTVDESNRDVAELVRRYRLQTAGGRADSEVAYDVEEGAATPAPEELDIDDIEFDDRVAEIEDEPQVDDAIDDFDPDELIGSPMAHGSPTPSVPPSAPAYVPVQVPAYVPPQVSPAKSAPARVAAGVHADSRFEGGAETKQVSAESIRALVEMSNDADELEFEDGVVETPHTDDEAVAYGTEARGQWEAPRAAASLAQHQNAASWRGESEGGWRQQSQLDAAIEAQLDDGALAEDIDGEVAAEMASAPPDQMPFDRDAARAFDTSAKGPSRASSTTIEDELDEAEFYLSQNMVQEATDVLHALLGKFPNHPLVTAKLQELGHLGGGARVESVPSPRAGAGAAGSTNLLSVDDLQVVEDSDVEGEVFDEASEGHSVGGKNKKPQVMLEKPVDDADAETHYDLGLAYKEMGLLDEAIRAFEKVARASGREVQCRLMIGLCHREQGNHSEAINNFKQGLHAHGVTERERQSLYYEIGLTYEAIGDTGEALYYLEMVIKRDPSFLDAAERVAMLRDRGGKRSTSHQDGGALDV